MAKTVDITIVGTVLFLPDCAGYIGHDQATFKGIAILARHLGQSNTGDIV